MGRDENVQAQRRTGWKSPGEWQKYYRGWIYARCPYCGKEKFFFSGDGTAEAGCRECGHVYDLRGMRRMYSNCECGRQTKYLTNIDDAMFDACCPVCHSPVAVMWDDNRKHYTTISNEAKRARKRKRHGIREGGAD